MCAAGNAWRVGGQRDRPVGPQVRRAPPRMCAAGDARRVCGRRDRSAAKLPSGGLVPGGASVISAVKPPRTGRRGDPWRPAARPGRARFRLSAVSRPFALSLSLTLSLSAVSRRPDVRRPPPRTPRAARRCAVRRHACAPPGMRGGFAVGEPVPPPSNRAAAFCLAAHGSTARLSRHAPGAGAIRGGLQHGRSALASAFRQFPPSHALALANAFAFGSFPPFHALALALANAFAFAVLRCPTLTLSLSVLPRRRRGVTDR